jgi:RNA polymerase sigma-70 factor (ECF subfamily)
MLDPVTRARSLGASVAFARRDGEHAAAPEALPDLLLVERARGGDPRAIEALIRRYGRRLYRVARSVLGDDEAAELAVQEACLVAFRSLNSQAGGGKFAPWLTRLAFSHACAQRVSARPEGPRDNAVPPPLPEEGTADGEAQERLVLECALSRLPEVFRTVLVLRVVEGISSVETAASLGVHETTIRTRLYRAQRRLAPELTSRLRLVPGLLAPTSERLERIVARALALLPHGAMLTISASPP